MKTLKTAFILAAVAILLAASCEKDPIPPKPSPALDYREKWTGTYTIVNNWDCHYVVSITDNTDSMMHVEGGVGWTLNRDILIHSDGTFAYRSGSGIYDTISGYFTLAEVQGEADSLYIEYLVPGHFSPASQKNYCVKMPTEWSE